jgi:hypothetical protein
MSWLTAKAEDFPPSESEKWNVPELKNPEIPILDSYDQPAKNTFWNDFPSSKDLRGRRGKIKIFKLQKLIQKCWFVWTLPEKNTAKRALKNLRGAAVKMTQNLPAIITRNAKSAIENGRWITDTIATWIKNGFVLGPFSSPPLKNFRVNPLMAAVQRTKVRPILNLSSPKGRAFNDAVDPWHIKKLTMSSPKLFSENLIRMGKHAKFSKSDIQDAYKTIPNAIEQRHYYGFKWLGKFFYDKTTVFGSAAAPAWFDPLSELIVNIVCTLGKVPKKFVHRQLDDVPMISPANSGLTEKFYTEYKKKKSL